MLKIHEIDSPLQLAELRPSWDMLLEREGMACPFLSYEWILCCIASYGGEKTPAVLAITDGSDLVGIAPLWRYEDTVRHIRCRKIGFITCPDTQLADFLLADNRREECLREIFQYLLGQMRSGWDLLTFDQWPADSPNVPILNPILREMGASYFVGTSSIMPCLSVKGEWEGFWRSRSQRFRKSHRNVINRVSRLGTIAVQCHTVDKTGSVFKDVLKVSEQSWKYNEGIGISSSQSAWTFFEKLTELAGPRGWLNVWLLKVNDAAVAMEYDLVHGDRVYALRADFDSAFRDSSPGAYLECEIIKHAFGVGYSMYGFGPGVREYKSHWTEDHKRNLVLTVCNKSFRGKMVSAMEVWIAPLIRRMKSAIVTEKTGSRSQDDSSEPS